MSIVNSGSHQALFTINHHYLFSTIINHHQPWLTIFKHDQTLDTQLVIGTGTGLARVPNSTHRWVTPPTAGGDWNAKKRPSRARSLESQNWRVTRPTIDTTNKLRVTPYVSAHFYTSPNGLEKEFDENSYKHCRMFKVLWLSCPKVLGNLALATIHSVCPLQLITTFDGVSKSCFQE